jgi:phosphatidylinositol alpha-1,6-mannosyltransferase
MPDLLVTYDFPPLGGGIARWLEELAARTDLIVSTGTMLNADDRRFGGRVDRLRVPSSKLKNPTGLLAWRRRLGRLIRERRPDFLWVGNLRPAGPVAAWAARGRRIPYALMVHGGDLLQLRARCRDRPLRRKIHRLVASRAAAVVANSRWTAALAVDVLGGLGVSVAEKTVVIPLGSDPARFRPSPADPRIREAYRLPDRRWLVTVARLVPHKGIDVAIEVLGRLAARHPDLGYVVVGSGPDRDRLTRLAAAAGVGDRVAILESVPDAHVPCLLNLASCYMGLSRVEGLDVEGFGISLVDAAASGLPVVAGRTGGIEDAVHDGETGLLVPPQDAEAIAVLVDRLLLDHDRRAEMGAAGRRWVEAERNWDRVVRDSVALSRVAATAARR